MTVSPPRPVSRRLKHQLQAFGLLILLALAGWGWVASTPWRLCREAESLLKTDPLAAEKLLAESVELTGDDYPLAQLLRARALGMQNRWIEAAGSYSMIPDKSECPPEHLLALAREAELARQPPLADLCLAELSQRTDTLPAAALEELIQLRTTRKEWAAASSLASRLTEIMPSSPLPILVAARRERYQNHFTESARLFAEYLSRPDAVDPAAVREEYVGLLIDLGESAPAREELDRLKQAGTLSDSALLLEIWLLRLEGKTEAALELVQSVLERRPEHPAGLVLRGTLRLDQEEAEAAIPDLSRACELNRYNKEAHFKLGMALVQAGKQDEAEPYLERSRELTQAAARILDLEPQVATDPNQPELLAELLELYRQVGRLSDAERLQRYLERRPG